jgi:hypothetical protein
MMELVAPFDLPNQDTDLDKIRDTGWFREFLAAL